MVTRGDYLSGNVIICSWCKKPWMLIAYILWFSNESIDFSLEQNKKLKNT